MEKKTFNIKLTKHIEQITLLEDFYKNDQKTIVKTETAPKVGNIITLMEKNDIYQAEITSVEAVDEDKYEIVLDTPLDSSFSVECLAEIGDSNLALDGSMDLKLIVLYLGNLGEYEAFYLKKVVFNIEDKKEADTDKFGGMDRLRNGVVLKTTGMNTRNLINAKQNKDFVLNSYNLEFDRNHPAGKYVVFAKKKYMINLDGLQVIIQDDLTKLEELSITAQICVKTINL